MKKDSHQSPALWSLAGDGSLIDIAIARGFNPKPGSRLLIQPRASGAIYLNPKNLRASMRYCSFGKESFIGSAAVYCLKSFKGVPLKNGSTHKSGWLHSNLATVCALSGHMNTAFTLTQSGCDAPDSAVACMELTEALSSNELGILQSKIDALALKAILTSQTNNKTSKLTPANPIIITDTAPTKRRILKA